LNFNETIHTLSCPSCGGRVTYAPGKPTAMCAWCGSTVVLPATNAAPKPFAVPNEPLHAHVARLVLAGHDGAAVQLLRDELGLSLAAAGHAVEQIRLGQGKDAERVIREAEEGKI
jgi:hypothetical protein